MFYFELWSDSDEIAESNFSVINCLFAADRIV